MERFDVDSFNKFLHSSKMGRKFVYTDITGSTMDDARRLAHDVREYPHGTIVMSERQTKARGERDHKWDASNTGNVYVSVVLHMPPVFKTSEGILDLEVAACLAVLRVVKEFGVTKVVPKWPNDLWVRGHKLAGFLVEDGRLDIPGTQDCLFILGIGINVNADVRRSSELQSIATSMICERGGVRVNREKFLAEVCVSLEPMLANTREDNHRIFLKENLFQQNCEISVSNSLSGKVMDGKFVTVCKNWDVKFVDTRTGEVIRGSTDVYTIRPKVVNKIMVVFASIQNTNIANSLSKWLTAIIDTSKYVVCLVPESTITATDDWMKRCSLIILVEDVCDPDLFTKKLTLYLKSGGRVMACGKGSVYLANLLHIQVKETVLESSHDSAIVLVRLQVETIPRITSLSQSAIGGNMSTVSDTAPISDTLPVIDNLHVSDAVSTAKLGSDSERLSSHHQPLIIIFPTNSTCFHVCENESSVCCLSSDIQDELHLENSSVKQSVQSENSSHDTQVKAYFINIGDQEKVLTVFTGNVTGGGRVALWGFNIPCVPVAHVASAQEMKAVEEDRFKRDHFLQQVLEVLLKP